LRRAGGRRSGGGCDIVSGCEKKRGVEIFASFLVSISLLKGEDNVPQHPILLGLNVLCIGISEHDRSHHVTAARYWQATPGLLRFVSVVNVCNCNTSSHELRLLAPASKMFSFSKENIEIYASIAISRVKNNRPAAFSLVAISRARPACSEPFSLPRQA
jgi:hypothetical protein